MVPITNIQIDRQESIELHDITTHDYRQQLAYLISITLDSIPNPNTKRAYSYHLGKFAKLRLPLSRLGVLQYTSQPTLTISNRQMALAALRKLTRNAESDLFLSPIESRQIETIKSPKSTPKIGHWLTLEGVRQLLSLATPNTLDGSRDGALFALLLGCGLRRNEAVTATWDNYRLVDDRHCLVDLLGKGNKYRTVPIPAWASSRIDSWRKRLDYEVGDPSVVQDGPILRSLMLDRLRYLRRPLDQNGVYVIIRAYSSILGIKFSPHDLRRTLARLMRQAGAPIEQITLILGHESIRTTERYLGGSLVIEAGKAGVDLIQW